MASGRALPRRVRHRQADREALLAAAEAVFAERGFHAASMRQIARRAGFSIGGVYQFFASKDALYLAVIDGRWRHSLGLVREAMKAKGCLGRLELLTRLALADMDLRLGFWRVVAVEDAALPASFRRRILQRTRAHVVEARRLVAAIMRDGVHEGILRNLDVRLLTSIYVGLVRQLVFDAVVLGTKVPSPEVALGIFLNGVARPGSHT